MLREEACEGNYLEPPCRLIRSGPHREAGDLAQAETLLASAHDWAVARDAKEVLCWAALVQARIALADASGSVCPERAQPTSPGQRPGLTDPANPQALKGRNKRPAETLSRPFRAHPDVMDSGTQGDALGWWVADPSGLKSAETALADGLKIARDCGFGLFHIDLLLERARLHLLSGEPQAALDDLRTALNGGVPANEQTGQP